MRDTLIIDPADNVAIALRPLAAGEGVGGVTTRDAVPAGHKVARRVIPAGAAVVKYGHPIGVAAVEIAAGEHVHTHNVRSALSDRLEELTFEAVAGGGRAGVVPEVVPEGRALTFQGYRRPDGRAGTRNEVWIVNTVGCVNQASQRIAAAAHRELAGEGGGGIDGVYAFPHPFGCSQLGDDLYHTQLVLAGLVRHPNAAAVLILGLGCENNQMELFLGQLAPGEREYVEFFNTQDVPDEVEAGVEAVRRLAGRVSGRRREPIPAAELVVGMKCGGSDGFSGITANPVVGRVADRLTAAGGTVLLTEVPEMFGAERVLLARACDAEVFRRTVELVTDFRGYFRRYGQPVDENPSPGNKAGGISTLAEKSLGCVQKGGRAPVREVLPYGGTASPGLGGLALLKAPGNDGVSSTAMTVAGAHCLLFTTGRGTPMGFPASTLKIASNTDLARRKPNWIDFDAGPVVGGERTLDELADELLALVLETCSGRPAKNELHDHREIAIWKDGVTL